MCMTDTIRKKGKLKIKEMKSWRRPLPLVCVRNVIKIAAGIRFWKMSRSRRNFFSPVRWFGVVNETRSHCTGGENTEVKFFFAAGVRVKLSAATTAGEQTNHSRLRRRETSAACAGISLVDKAGAFDLRRRRINSRVDVYPLPPLAKQIQKKKMFAFRDDCGGRLHFSVTLVENK